MLTFCVVVVFVQKSSTDFPRTQELSTIAPSPGQLPLETSTTSNSRSPVPKHTAALDPEPQDTSSSSVVEWASPVNVLPDPIQMPIILRSRAPRESPSSIVLESPQAHLLQTGVIIFLTEMGTKNVLTDQHAKKVESDSRGPEDIAIGLVNYVLNCITGK